MIGSEDLSIRWKRDLAMAKIKREAWDTSKHSWMAQRSMFKPVMGGQQPNPRKPRQLRTDDVSTWLGRHGLSQWERPNVTLVNTNKRCHQVRGKDYGCDCTWVFKHSNVDTVRCWLCTAERPY